VLSTAEVDVLAAPLDISRDELVRLGDILVPAELRRALRLRGRAKRQFVATRAILRALLAERLAVAPAAVPLQVRKDGKLFVPGDVMFNVAHSQDLAVFAFTRNRRVGVDVELLRPVSRLPGVVELALAPWEAAELQSVPARDRRAAFFACWTRKEAYLKASGNGRGSPGEVAVSLRPGAAARLVCVEGRPSEPDRWELTSFEPRPGFVGAVAVEVAL